MPAATPQPKPAGTNATALLETWRAIRPRLLQRRMRTQIGPGKHRRTCLYEGHSPASMPQISMPAGLLEVIASVNRLLKVGKKVVYVLKANGDANKAIL